MYVFRVVGVEVYGGVDPDTYRVLKLYVYWVIELYSYRDVELYTYSVVVDLDTYSCKVVHL